MLHVLITGAYYPPVVTTWRIFTRGASYLTTGTLCIVRLTQTHGYNFHYLYKIYTDIARNSGLKSFSSSKYGCGEH